MRFAYLRVPTVILLAISALFFPFWITGALFILGTFFLRNFYFGMIMLFFMDIVYAFEGFEFGPFYGILTISGILIFFIILIIKERIFNLE